MGETFVIEENAYNKLAAHVENTYPDEACGILIGSIQDNRIYDIHEIVNREKDKKKSFFSISPMDICKFEKEQKEIIGFYHSHPDKMAILSSLDKEYMMPYVLNLVFSVTKNGVFDMRAYKKEGFEITEVIEKSVLVHI